MQQDQEIEIVIVMVTRFLPGETVGGYTEVQKVWQAWTKRALSKTVCAGRGGGGAATGCACVGFGAIQAGGFLPVEASGG